jgi:hypothetical protein
MALISLMVLLLTVINTIGGLVQLVLDGQADAASLTDLGQGSVLWWLLLAVIAGSVWGLHWSRANREARALTIAGSIDRDAPERKAYLYVTKFGALAVLVTEAGLALYSWFLYALGQPRELLGSWPARPISATLGAAVALIIWAYQHWIVVQDGDLGREFGAGVSWRRGYYYLGTGLATLLAAFGAGEFVRTFLTVAGRNYSFGMPAGDANTWRAFAAASAAIAVVALPLAFLLWHRANRVVALGDTAAEVNAMSRKLLLYSGTMAGAAVTLVSFGFLVWQALLIGLGQTVANLQTYWEGSLVPALAYLPVGVIIWLAYNTVVHEDIEWSVESEDSAILRRLYYYLIAALGLVAFWYGLQALLVLALLLALGVWPSSILAGAQARQYFTLAGALFVVGGPVWWAHWHAEQVLAREPGPTGQAERSSVLRRVYLYGVVVAAGLVAIVTLIMVISRAPGWLFGPTTAGSFGQSMVQLGVGIAVALVWWIAHGFVMRGDERLRAQDARRAASRAAVIPGEPNSLPPAVPEAIVAPAVTAAATPALATGLTPAPDLQPLPGAVAAGATAFVGPGSEEGQSPMAEAVVAASPLLLRSRRFAILAVVDGGDGALGASLILALRQAFPNLVLWPVSLSEPAQTAMAAALDGQVPEPMLAATDAISRAAVVLGSSDILAPGGLDGEVTPELAAAILTGSAHKVLLPPRQARIRWVGAPDWPRERWVENAVAEVAASLAVEQAGAR